MRKAALPAPVTRAPEEGRTNGEEKECISDTALRVKVCACGRVCARVCAAKHKSISETVMTAILILLCLSVFQTHQR